MLPLGLPRGLPRGVAGWGLPSGAPAFTPPSSPLPRFRPPRPPLYYVHALLLLSKLRKFMNSLKLCKFLFIFGFTSHVINQIVGWLLGGEGASPGAAPGLHGFSLLWGGVCCPEAGWGLPRKWVKIIRNQCKSNKNQEI